MLLGGVPGVEAGNVTILGAGMAGRNATMIAAGMGADVTVLDLNVAPLRHLDELQWRNVKTQTSSKFASDAFSGMCHTPRAAISPLLMREVNKTPMMGAA